MLFSGSFRPWHGVHVLEDAARAAAPSRRPLLRPGRRRRGRAGRRLPRPAPRRACPTSGCPRSWRAADIGVAPYDTARLRQLRLGFYWSPLKIFEYMACGLPTVTDPPRSARPRSCATGRRGCTSTRRCRRAWPTPSWAGRRRGAAPAAGGQRARGAWSSSYSWAAHCEQLEGVLRAGDRGVRIVLASEVYPPRAGGAGWSTRALALGLRAAGHDVTVLTTSPGPATWTA